MTQSENPTLWAAIEQTGTAPKRALHAAHGSVELDALRRGSSLSAGLRAFRDRCVLVVVKDQLAAALALIELDGTARRMVLCPPGLAATHLPHVIATAGVDAVVGDDGADQEWPDAVTLVASGSSRIRPTDAVRSRGNATEWVLLTSGTTGVPKLVLHTLASLCGAIKPGSIASPDIVWSTFYDIRRYGGLQIFLRAVLGGGSLLLSGGDETLPDFLVRAGKSGVTHISGTPSHWRRALMSPAAGAMAPRYVRLSGEIADQPVLDQLKAFYKADVGHAFASTEAGVAFEVRDGLAGFPAALLHSRDGDVEMKVESGSLRIRSIRTATCYLGQPEKPLRDPSGFVDTGDSVAEREGRYFFVGRADGVINIGGQKVHPEEVEAVINAVPGVAMSVVRARKSPITGAIVVADVVPSDGADLQPEVLKAAIMAACRGALAPYQVPATIRFVEGMTVGASGKVARTG